MAYILTKKQWNFVFETLNVINKKQVNLEHSTGASMCKNCTKCCQVQTPYVSFLDALWVTYGIEKLKLKNYFKLKLYEYLKNCKNMGFYERCPFLGDRGCMVHGYHPMVCRAYNFTRPGSSGCGDARQPGLGTSEDAQKLVAFYFNKRKEFEKMWKIQDKGSIGMLPATVYTLIENNEVFRERIRRKEFNEKLFMAQLRDDDSDYDKFIGYNPYLL